MKSHYKHLPMLPGIYLFKNNTGKVIYIGKAKLLRPRVQSYFQTQKDWKTDLLVTHTHTVDHIITHKEIDALLLEAHLIRVYQPKYNVLLKTGQPFLYFAFTHDTPPLFTLVRTKNRNGTFFGPFLYKEQTRRAYNFIMKTFRLFQCNKKIDLGCLDYHLGNCSGSCRPDFNQQEYLLRIALSKEVLKSDRNAFIAHIDTHIKNESSVLAFEKAQQLLQYRHNIDYIFDTLQEHFSPKKYLSDISRATSTISLYTQYKTAAQDLQKLLGLKNSPETIDCFDVYHFQSKQIVGSCIRFYKGIPDTKKFRRFKIRSLLKQNDCAALKEVVCRRYKKNDYPDLIVIDGGKGQRNAISPLVSPVTCISIAKREELLISDQYPHGTPLCPTKEFGKLLLSLRDYAHHFAITYHRVLRTKQIEEKHDN